MRGQHTPSVPWGSPVSPQCCPQRSSKTRLPPLEPDCQVEDPKVPAAPRTPTPRLTWTARTSPSCRRTCCRAASSAGPAHLCAPPPPPAQVGHLALISAARPAPRADLRPGAASEGWAPGPSPRSPPRSPPRPQTDCRADRRTDARWRGAGRRAAGGEGAGFLLRTSRTSFALGATSRRRCGPARGARAGGGTRGSGSG